MSDLPPRLVTALSERYRIERELGAGGMATVYLADDRKHDRKVALKVLKPELAAVVGAERFVAEIRTTANLQHPHILPLFDSGEADGFLFYVMPYVAGESLRERLDREKQLPVDEAVAIATKVAGALQAAHARGIVHRDIKPANILLDAQGEPLVADFGIALAVQEAGGGRLTETGLSLGTPYYMSPEQATGDRDPDARSDVYALGAVLYEMLTGEPPFTGGTAQAVLGKILTGAVTRPTKVRASIPPNVEGAVLRALERLPADRFPSAEAFAAAVADPGFRHRSGGGHGVVGGDSQRTPPSIVSRVLAVAPWVAVAVLAGLLVIRGSGDANAGARPALTAALNIPERLEVDAGSRWGALSPDGRIFAFNALGPDGSALYLQDLTTGRTEPLRGGGGATAPIWSPNGERIAFIRDQQLMVVSATGGAVDRLCEGPFDAWASGSWGPDGRLVVSDGSRLILVDPGVSCEPLPVPDGTWLRPLHAPGGRTLFVFGVPDSARSGRLYDLDLTSMDLRDVGPGAAAYPTDEGFLLVSAGSTVSALPYDFEGRVATGESVELTADVLQSYNGPTLSVSGGRFVYLSRSSATSDSPSLLVRDGVVVDSLPRGAGWTNAAARESPWVAQGGVGLRIIDIETRAVRQVTEERVLEVAVVPGDSLVAAGRPFGAPEGCELAFIDPISGTVARSLVHGGGCLQPLDFTPDGRRLLARYVGGRRRVDDSALLMVDLETETVEPLVDESGTLHHAALSSDGRWVAYAMDGQVIVRAVAGGVPPTVVSGGEFAVRVDWHPTERRLFFVAAPGGIRAVDVGDDGRPVGEPVRVFEAEWSRLRFLNTNATGFQALSDGETLLVSGGALNASRRAIVVVDLWPEVLRAGGVPRPEGP